MEVDIVDDNTTEIDDICLILSSLTTTTQPCEDMEITGPILPQKNLTPADYLKNFEKSKYQEDNSTMKSMDDQKSVLQNRLKDQVKLLDAFLLCNDNVRTLKRRWRGGVDDERERWYQEVEAAKMKKRYLMINIHNTGQDIQSRNRTKSI